MSKIIEDCKQSPFLFDNRAKKHIVESNKKNFSMTLINMNLNPETLSFTLSFTLFAFIAYIAFKAVQYAERLKRKEVGTLTPFVEKKPANKSYQQRILYMQRMMAVKFNTFNRRYKTRPRRR